MRVQNVSAVRNDSAMKGAQVRTTVNRGTTQAVLRGKWAVAAISGFVSGFFAPEITAAKAKRNARRVTK